MNTAAVIIAAGFATASNCAWPQRDNYPTRPIRMLCGFSVGAGSDFAARIVGAKLAELPRQAVVVDNRTGANGAIAAEITALADVAGRQVQFMISSIQVSLPLARGGKLRALAVTSEKRSHAAAHYRQTG